MGHLKSYYKISEKYIIFSLFGTLFFIYSFFVSKEIIKVIGLICIVLSIISMLIFVLRLFKLNLIYY